MDARNLKVETFGPLSPRQAKEACVAHVCPKCGTDHHVTVGASAARPNDGDVVSLPRLRSLVASRRAGDARIVGLPLGAGQSRR